MVVGDVVVVEVKGNSEFFVLCVGCKFEGVLEYFGIDVVGCVCFDIGVLMGGFMDCLLQCGVEKVYVIDVGYNQFDYWLCIDLWVVVMECINVCYFEFDQFLECVLFCVVDVLFILLIKVVLVFVLFFDEGVDFVFLIKLQFEVGCDFVGKGGIVWDEEVCCCVIEEWVGDFEVLGFFV